MRTKTQGFLLNCIRFVVFGREMPEAGVDLTQPENADAVFKLALNHDFIHIVSDAVYKNNIPVDKTVSEKLVKNQMFANYRMENIELEADSLAKTFGEADIPYILLKGASMLSLYPEVWMRTSCDVDVFVGRDNFDKSLELLKSSGYKAAAVGSHDIHLSSRNGVEVELHFDFMDIGSNPKIEKILYAESWKHRKKNDRGHWVFDDEMMYFFHTAHLYKHFTTGGCGIKFVLDTFLLRQKLSIDFSVVNAWLEQAGIKKFDDGITGLAMYWFGNGEPSLTAEDLEYFFFHTATYGDTRTHCTEDGASKPVQIFEYVFLPYDKLCCLYPKLRSHMGLYLYYVFKRLFSRLFGGKFKRSMLYLNEILAVKDEDRKRMKRLFKEVGIDE